ncbi:MAG TPA: hypothetical protein DHV65_18525, partial [Ktedonobacter sp.]|nr:hypothetical protein [Ktedonobacter sp.]
RNRAQRAADEAIAGGFLNVTIRGAKRVLFNISGGEDMTLFEVNEVAERIAQAIDDTADITFGAVIDPILKDSIRVTLIAAGMEERSTARIPAIHLNQSLSTPINVTPPNAPQSKPVTPMTPPSRSANRDGQQRPQSYTPQPTPPRPPRSSGVPGRQQRSLEDLRGIRSMGRRREPPKGQQTDEDEGERGIEIPPYFKKYD